MEEKGPRVEAVLAWYLVEVGRVRHHEWRTDVLHLGEFEGTEGRLFPQKISCTRLVLALGI